MRTAIQKKIADITAATNMLGASTGAYFALYNLFFATYVFVARNADYMHNKKVSEGINYAAYAFSAIALIALFLPVFMKLKNQCAQQVDVTDNVDTSLILDAVRRDVNAALRDPSSQQKSTLPPYKTIQTILFFLANVGTVVAPFNFERVCNKKFDIQVSSTPVVREIYFALSIVFSLLTAIAQPLQTRYQFHSPLLTAFIECCSKSGSFVGGIFAALLLQIQWMGFDSIHSNEGNALAATASGLFIADICLLYAALRCNSGNLEQAQQWIQHKISHHATPTETVLWHAHLVLDTLRALVSASGNLLGVANILSTSEQFDQVTTGVIKKNILTAMGGAGFLAGISNAQKLIASRTVSTAAGANVL